MSTPNLESCFAISSFSLLVKVAPGDCSPSLHIPLQIYFLYSFLEIDLIQCISLSIYRGKFACLLVQLTIKQFQKWLIEHRWGIVSDRIWAILESKLVAQCRSADVSCCPCCLSHSFIWWHAILLRLSTEDWYDYSSCTADLLHKWSAGGSRVRRRTWEWYQRFVRNWDPLSSLECI